MRCLLSNMDNLYYIDSHVHLNDEKILLHIDEVISDAIKENVQKLIIIGWDIESSIKAIELAHTYNQYCAVGIHPCNLKGITDNDYLKLEEIAKDDKVLAIGEIGFDYYWDDTTRSEQEIGFQKQIDIAKKVCKPVIIHSREADQDTFDMIKTNYNNDLCGIIHAYSGSLELAKEYIKMGFYLGVGGVLTFKNAKQLPNVVENISLDYILSETDAPYLAPTPHRGEENGPKYIPLIVSKIAELKNTTIENVQIAIINNFKKLFKKD